MCHFSLHYIFRFTYLSFLKHCHAHYYKYKIIDFFPVYKHQLHSNFTMHLWRQVLTSSILFCPFWFALLLFTFLASLLLPRPLLYFCVSFFTNCVVLHNAPMTSFPTVFLGLMEWDTKHFLLPFSLQVGGVINTILIPPLMSSTTILFQVSHFVLTFRSSKVLESLLPGLTAAFGTFNVCLSRTDLSLNMGSTISSNLYEIFPTIRFSHQLSAITHLNFSNFLRVLY